MIKAERIHSVIYYELPEKWVLKGKHKPHQMTGDLKTEGDYVVVILIINLFLA